MSGTVRTAVELADADGLTAVSMRSVAKRLDVEAMSLYNRVRTKDDVLDGMVDVMFDEFHSPATGSDWVAEMGMRPRAAAGRRERRVALTSSTPPRLHSAADPVRCRGRRRHSRRR